LLARCGLKRSDKAGFSDLSIRQAIIWVVAGREMRAMLLRLKDVRQGNIAG
jgi:hypothetical protein